MTIMLHELCHEDVSAKEHSHDDEFFQMFHDFMCYNGIGSPVRQAALVYLAQCKRLGIKMNREEVRTADLESSIDREVFGDEQFINGIAAAEQEAE